MHGRSEITDKTQQMSRSECPPADLLAKVERECDKQQQVETNDPNSHPERTVCICKRNQDLDEVEWQVMIKQQYDHVQEYKSQPQK